MLEEITNLTVHPIVQSDATVISPPLKAIDLLEGGALKFRDTAGNTVTKTFPTIATGGIYPYRFWCRIDKVFDTDTAITDAQMIGIR